MNERINGNKKSERILKDSIKACVCFFLVLILVSGCIDQGTSPETAVEDSSGDLEVPESEESDTGESTPPGSGIESDGPPLPAADVIITVIYDNRPHNPDLTPSWGFSCLIRGCEKTILFDTGGDRSIVSRNMQKLGISPEEIDVIVLSHFHGDHVDGLPAVLEKNSDVTVYVLQSFPFSFKENVANQGARIVEVSDPIKICEHVYSTGEIGGIANEQSLIMRTDRGLIVITGCAHPGIVGIAKKAKDLLQDDILLVMGGFHLVDTSRSAIERIISDFRALKVLYAGSCHCTGVEAMELFEQEYGENYVEIGVGTVIYVKGLV